MVASKNNSKNLWSLLSVVLALIFLAALQIAFFNPSFFGLNIILNLILILVLAKYNKSAIFFGWILGLLTDTAHFSNFGTNSLVFLTIALILIIIYKTVFFSLKTENVIFMALIVVFLYHFVDWFILKSLALLNHSSFEGFGFYFISWDFPIEFITIVVFTLVIFKCFRTFFGNEQKI